MRVRQWRFIISQSRERRVPDHVSSYFGSRLDNFILLVSTNGCAGRIVWKVHHYEARLGSDESLKLLEIGDEFRLEAQSPGLQTATSRFRQVAVREIARVQGYGFIARSQKRVHH